MDSWRRPEYRTMSYTLRPCSEWIYLPFPALQSRISANLSRSESRLLSCHHVALRSTESCYSTPITATAVTTSPPLLALQTTFAVGAVQARRRSGKSEKCHIHVYPKREIRDFPIVAVFENDRVHPGYLGVGGEEHQVLRVKGWKGGWPTTATRIEQVANNINTHLPTLRPVHTKHIIFRNLHLVYTREPV
jgi:hypothetical protein